MNAGTDTQREAQAAAASWDVRLRSHGCTDRDRTAFKTWLDADTQHQEAFDRLQLALGALREAADHPQLRSLRERAEVMTRRSLARRLGLRASIAAGIAMIAVMTAVLFQHERERLAVSRRIASSQVGDAARDARGEVYTTGLRERRTLALPDGSSATLNSGTRLEADWLPHERRIRLVAGQALFRVAKDPTRPFVVTAGDRAVTALGTAFDVSLDADKVQVTLLEGRVAVRGVGRAAPQPSLELSPNQQLVAIDGQPPTVRTVDVARSTGWVNGQVFFTDEALPAAIAQMNGYSSQEIIIADPELAHYRVNGMFLAGNQDGFVSALTSYYPIEARRDAQGRIVLMPRPGGAEAR